jgi:hypothetical protein
MKKSDFFLWQWDKVARGGCKCVAIGWRSNARRGDLHLLRRRTRASSHLCRDDIDLDPKRSKRKVRVGLFDSPVHQTVVASNLHKLKGVCPDACAARDVMDTCPRRR